MPDPEVLVLSAALCPAVFVGVLTRLLPAETLCLFVGDVRTLFVTDGGSFSTPVEALCSYLDINAFRPSEVEEEWRFRPAGGDALIGPPMLAEATRRIVKSSGRVLCHFS